MTHEVSIASKLRIAEAIIKQIAMVTDVLNTDNNAVYKATSVANMLANDYIRKVKKDTSFGV